MQQLEAVQAPLKLGTYFFPKTIFESNTKGKFEELKVPEVKSVYTNASPKDEDAFQWTVLLAIESEDFENNPNACFHFDIHAFGTFEWTGSEEADLDYRKKVMAVSGASILYSATRDYLGIISAQSPFARYTLPAIQFRPIDEPEERPE